MAVAYSGQSSGITSATLPTHAAGDLIVCFGYRDGNATLFTVPGGWTTLDHQQGQALAHNGGLFYKIAASSSETSGTWTNASEVVFHVYTGAEVGAWVQNAGTTLTINFAALTFDVGDGSSWAAGFSGYRQADTTLESPPTGMTNRSNYSNASPSSEASGHDTNGGVTGWSSTNQTLTGSSGGWITYVLELKATGSSADALLADDIEAASEVSSPSVGQLHGLAANDVQAASSVSAPVLGQVHALLAVDVEASSEVGAPALGQLVALLANGVQATSEVSAPALAQIHALAANDVQSASSVATPALGQTHALSAADVESGSEVSAPALAEVVEGSDALLANDVEAQTEVTSPSLGQIHALAANDIEAASDVTAPVLGGDIVEPEQPEEPEIGGGAGRSASTRTRAIYRRKPSELPEWERPSQPKAPSKAKAYKQSKAETFQHLDTKPLPEQAPIASAQDALDVEFLAAIEAAQIEIKAREQEAIMLLLLAA